MWACVCVCAAQFRELLGQHFYFVAAPPLCEQVWMRNMYIFSLPYKLHFATVSCKNCNFRFRWFALLPSHIRLLSTVFCISNKRFALFSQASVVSAVVVIIFLHHSCVCMCAYKRALRNNVHSPIDHLLVKIICYILCVHTHVRPSLLGHASRQYVNFGWHADSASSVASRYTCKLFRKCICRYVRVCVCVCGHASGAVCLLSTVQWSDSLSATASLFFLLHVLVFKCGNMAL